MKPIYLDLQAVAQALSLSESNVKKLVREQQFPPPRLLSGRRVGWLVRELEEWAESRPVSDLLPPPSGSDQR
jgi:prophage regulatory protein